MLNIYHVPGTRSVRVIWLCEELDIPYEAISVDFSASFRATPEWRAKNPVGKVPVLEDGDLRMFESGAMVQYLLDRYGDGALQPTAGTPEHALYLQWSWFAESTFARPLGEIVNHRREFKPEVPEAIEEMKSRGWLCVLALDEALANKAYVLGQDFSAADIMTGYSLMLAENLIGKSFPANVDGYWRRIKSRDAYQRTLAVK